MPEALTTERVRGRLDNLLLDSYRDLASIMKGVALAAATFVGLEILISWSTAWPRILPWMASLLASIVSYMTWGRGVLLANSRGSLWDTVLPFLIGIDEFCLFAILAPRPESPDVWRWWFAVLAGHGLTAALLTHNRVRNTDLQRDFAAELRQLGGEYQAWIRDDRFGAGVVSLLALASLVVAVVVLPRYITGTGYIVWYWILTVPFIGVFLVVISRADCQRRRIDEVVYAPTAVTAGS